MGLALGQITQEGCQGHLGLVQHEVIHLRELFIFGGKERAAGHHLQAGRLAAGNRPVGRTLLHHHGTDESIIGPFQVLGRERTDVQVHQAQLPILGQHGGHGQQAERHGAGLFADELQSVLETPERIREFRVKHEDLHGNLQTGLSKEYCSRQAKMPGSRTGDMVKRY